jgi:hypothetical protein
VARKRSPPRSWPLFQPNALDRWTPGLYLFFHLRTNTTTYLIYFTAYPSHY